MDGDTLWSRLDLSKDIEPAYDILKNSHVLLIGSGGLGSELALKLAGCRIGQLTLVDGDTVEQPNIPHSSIFLPRHIGRFKVDVVAEFVGEKFPDCTVIPEPLFIQECKQDIYQKHDMIVCAPDSDKARRWVNFFAHKCQKRTLFLGVSGMRDEWGGYTFLYTPDVSACFLCFASGGEEEQPETYTTVPETQDREEARKRCGVTNIAVPMLAPVVGLIANYAASVVLKSLIGIGTESYAYINLKKSSLVIRNIKSTPTCVVCGKPEEYELLHSGGTSIV